ncbi:hypothetical protein PflQ2_0574 [Pseudomonas fluorescens Q2-87]|uniref:Uncharacterized protein n=1 Tax=Pseudomonas fluorescens (strain Q2-87) TaxID=1038922 RepID=J2XVN2_PSEFQ|nr:hypothetical protein PflQ2_0574 [Pseudomonas fluorescens Q2-87]
MPEQIEKQAGKAGAGDDRESRWRRLNGLGEGGSPSFILQSITSGESRNKERGKHESRAMRGFFVWWAHTDSNRGPKDYELLGELICLEKPSETERSLA